MIRLQPIRRFSGKLYLNWQKQMKDSGITPAMTTGCALTIMQKKLPDRTLMSELPSSMQ